MLLPVIKPVFVIFQEPILPSVALTLPDKKTFSDIKPKPGFAAPNTAPVPANPPKSPNLAFLENPPLPDSTISMYGVSVSVGLAFISMNPVPGLPKLIITCPSSYVVATELSPLKLPIEPVTLPAAALVTVKAWSNPVELPVWSDAEKAAVNFKNSELKPVSSTFLQNSNSPALNPAAF